MYLSTLMLFVRQTPPENLEEREAAEELGGWKNKDTSPARLIWYWSLFCFEILSQNLTRIVQTTRCGWSLQCFVGRGQQRQRRQQKLFKQADVGEPWVIPSFPSTFLVAFKLGLLAGSGKTWNLIRPVNIVTVLHQHHHHHHPLVDVFTGASHHHPLQHHLFHCHYHPPVNIFISFSDPDNNVN